MKQLTSADSLSALLSPDDYSLLYFSASWCGPCRSMTPIVADVSTIMDERLRVIKIDVDRFNNDAADFGIRSVPTLMLMKKNEIIAQQVGGVSPQQLMQWLMQHTQLGFNN